MSVSTVLVAINAILLRLDPKKWQLTYRMIETP
jgi:hypothetical protein